MIIPNNYTLVKKIHFVAYLQLGPLHSRSIFLQLQIENNEKNKIFKQLLKYTKSNCCWLNIGCSLFFHFVVCVKEPQSDLHVLLSRDTYNDRDTHRSLQYCFIEIGVSNARGNRIQNTIVPVLKFQQPQIF